MAVTPLFLIAAASVNLYAQEEAPADIYVQEETPPVVEKPGLTPEQNRIDMDIRTSTLSELAAWCRSLGLSEGGTRTELARRLREYFKVSEQTFSGEDKRKVITIESARTSEYFTIETVDEDYARLSGEVRLNLKDGDAVHEIKAWNILFNRSRNILTASGGVEYVKKDGDTIETFRGESITVNLDNWSSVFLGGVSERSLQSDNTTYKFAGTVISRDEEEVTILSEASIGSANNEEALWSLNATRVWLLPGSDFAIFNAILKVGEIPVFYIPFFYYPADEVIFHPVIGFRAREGNYIQTTTYILGRPKASSSSQSSLTKILGNSSDMEKKREGLFLRSTGKKAVNQNQPSLRVLLDHYANLGTYIGADLDLPAKGILGSLNLSLGFGLTRTVVQDEGIYTPFFPDYNGDIDWNKSNLFSTEVPFRYRFKTNSMLKGTYGSFSWNLPFYSDPLVDRDFLQRAEDMDWVNMIQKGAAIDEDILTQNQLGPYSWQLSGQVNPKLPNMSPYINTLSVNTISTTMSFRMADIRNSYEQNDIKRYSPSSYFYMPDTATLYSLSGTLSGTPLTLGGTAEAPSKTQTDTGAWDDPLIKIGIPRSPFEDKGKEDEQRKNETDKLVPPELSQRFDLPRVGNNKVSIDYRIAPSGTSTLKFDYSKWKEFSDIDWGNVTSVLSNFQGDASTTVSFNHSENLYTNSFSYTGNWTKRDYWYLNEEAGDFIYGSGPDIGTTDPGKVANTKLQEYRQTFFSTSYDLSSSVQPLFWDPVFGSSSLQYKLRGLAVKSNFNGTADEPEWEKIYGEWDKEKIDTHQFSTNISALIMDKPQTFSMIADMPPRDGALSFRVGLRVWITETDANMRILFPGEEDKRKLEPFTLTERFNFGAFGSFSQSIILDTEKHGEPTSLTSSLNLSKWGLTVSYAAARMLGYEFIPLGSGDPNAGKWVQKTGDEKLQSRDFSMNYTKSISMTELLNNRLQFTVNTGSKLFFNLQEYTSSKFDFSLGFTVGINKFLDLSLSTNTENSSIYRYFRNWWFFKDADIDIPDGPQNNILLDLFNSFAFGDEEKRRSSGFKMKSFHISATHYLGDWNAILSWTMAPYRPPNKRQWDMNNEVTFLLQWIPISEFKSDVTFKKGNDPQWTVKQ
jgi:hypothetical protein